MVGVCPGPVVTEVGELVGAHGQDPVVVGGDGPEGAPGSPVEEGLHVERREPSQGIGGDPHRVPGGVAPVVGVEHVVAVEHDLHRPAGLHGEGGAGDLVGERVALAPEAPPHLGLDDPNPVHGQVQDLREGPVQVVGDLRGGPHREPAIRRVLGQDGVRLGEGVGDAGVAGAHPHGMGGGPPRAGEVAEVLEDLLLEVRVPEGSLVDLHGHGVPGHLGVVVDRERLVLHADPGERPLACLLVHGGHGHHALPDVPDPVHREGGLVVGHGEDPERPGVAVPREHGGDPRDLPGLRLIDLADPGVGMDRLEDPAHEEVGATEIVGVLGASGDLERGVDEGNPRPDEPVGDRGDLPRCGGGHAEGSPSRAMARDAASMASRIFTYPVQRQRFPETAREISSRVGDGWSRRKATAVMMKPGVQNPHWVAPFSTNAFCTGWRPPGGAIPSMVVISRPSASFASVRQERVGTPSRRTVQQPQVPRSHPLLEPVSPRSSRSTSRRIRWGGTESV